MPPTPPKRPSPTQRPDATSAGAQLAERARRRLALQLAEAAAKARTRPQPTLGARTLLDAVNERAGEQDRAMGAGLTSPVGSMTALAAAMHPHAQMLLAAPGALKFAQNPNPDADFATTAIGALATLPGEGQLGHAAVPVRPIKAAAVRAVDGRIFTGANHGAAFDAMKEAGGTYALQAEMSLARSSRNPLLDEGYVTHTGEFVDRKRGLELARGAGQTAERGDRGVAELMDGLEGRGALADSVVAGGARAAAGGLPLPPQRDLPRFIPPRVPQAKLDDVEEAFYRTYSGPTMERWTAEGGNGAWYDTQRTQQKAIDAAGETEGPARFRRLMEMVGSVTARSDPANNLRRGSYYYGLERAGLLDPDALAAGVYKDVPAGMGHFANNAHHAGLRRLLTEGQMNPIQNPKPAGFVENLSRNFQPYTHDTRMAVGAQLANPQLEQVGGLVRTVGKDGGVSFSPRDWAYAPSERAAQRAAQEYAGRGLLGDLPAGASPTAHWQAKVWDALGNVLPGASPNAGLFDDIFDEKVGAAAKLWGVSPSEANRLVWAGHPFDLPLGTDVIPKGLLGAP